MDSLSSRCFSPFTFSKESSCALKRWDRDHERRTSRSCASRHLPPPLTEKPHSLVGVGHVYAKLADFIARIIVEHLGRRAAVRHERLPCLLARDPCFRESNTRLERVQCHFCRVAEMPILHVVLPAKISLFLEHRLEHPDLAPPFVPSQHRPRFGLLFGVLHRYRLHRRCWCSYRCLHWWWIGGRRRRSRGSRRRRVIHAVAEKLGPRRLVDNASLLKVVAGLKREESVHSSLAEHPLLRVLVPDPEPSLFQELVQARNRSDVIRTHRQNWPLRVHH
mmetsp:Transcript_21878/g.70680  ORF Transcript_21878/g.70680 Transcript_21878/m.70680 type:complete len:277 (-) Transcript_21878:522-1352(-)